MESQTSAREIPGLKAYDFIPKCLKPYSMIRLQWPKFEPFSTLLPVINEFLKQNPTLSVRFCESVHFLVEKNTVKAERSDFNQPGEAQRPFVKGARLWVQERSSTQSQAEQVGFMTFVPDISPNASNTLEDLTSKVNHYLQTNPIPGKLLAVESLEMRGIKEGKVNVDASCWKPSYTMVTIKENFLSMFRIWYRVGPAQQQTIGFADFFPSSTADVCQRLPDVLAGVNNWVSQLPGNISVLNINRLATRMNDNGQPYDTYKTSKQDDHVPARYMRFLRVAYTISHHQNSGPLAGITSRLFAPALAPPATWKKTPKFEEQSATRHRLNMWLMQSQARVVGIETVMSKTRTGGEAESGLESMETWSEMQQRWNPHTRTYMYMPVSEQHLICYRVYVEGHVVDPPGFLWPASADALPRGDDGESCTIS